MNRLTAVLACGLALATACDQGPPEPSDVPLVEFDNDRSVALAMTVGKDGFDNNTFGGNGRTCVTCHFKENGTMTLEQINDLHATNPDDPLFLHDGLDDPNDPNSGNARLLAHGTVVVNIGLPAGVTLVDDPTATTVPLRRGTPTVKNIALDNVGAADPNARLDPVLMLDGRDPDLATQALGAINGHAQNTIEPTSTQLFAIGEFQRFAPRMYSNAKLLAYFYTGLTPALKPELPEGKTDAGKRGRRFFVDQPIDFDTGAGACAACHSGPMFNQANEFNCPPQSLDPSTGACDPNLPFVTPAGSRFQSSLVSETNFLGNPVIEFEIQTPNGPTVVATPDPGRALISNNWLPFPLGDLFAFKTPTLWGICETSPYMHDNSVKTLEAIPDHYQVLFDFLSSLPPEAATPPLVFTAQDKDDMVAFMQEAFCHP